MENTVSRLAEENDKHNDPCTVCYESLRCSGNRDVSRIPCGHHFHTDCLQQWIYRKPQSRVLSTWTCPLCRQEIPRPNIIQPKTEENYQLDFLDLDSLTLFRIRIQQYLAFRRNEIIEDLLLRNHDLPEFEAPLQDD